MANYYVATSGSDSASGSISSPFRTVYKALSVAAAGDTVNIRAGTYNERISFPSSGSSGNYITLQNYGFTAPTAIARGYPGAAGGESVVFDYVGLGTITDGTPFLGVTGKSYIRIQGLTFQNYQTNGGGPQLGLQVNGGSYVEVRNCRILSVTNIGPWDNTCATEAVFVRGGAHDVTIYGNEIANTVTLYSETLSVDGAYNVTISNNYIHDTDAIGIDVTSATGTAAHDVTIVGNVLEYIGKKRDGSYWYTSGGSPQHTQAVYSNGGYNVTVDGNVVRHSSNAYGCDAEAGYPYAYNFVYRNNVAWDCDEGLKIGTWYTSDYPTGANTHDIQFLHNTVVNCGDSVVIRPATGTNKIEGNLVYGGNGYVNLGSYNANATVDYNLWYSVGTAGPGSHNKTTNPSFVDGGAGNFALNSGSPAIDASDPAFSTTTLGTVDIVGNGRVLNSRADIGAYEYGTVTGSNDFSISISPSSQSITAGGSAGTYTVSTSLVSGTAETVALSASSLPSGVTASWSPSSVTAGGSSTLTLTAASGATIGADSFTVTGTATSATHTASATVVVSSSALPYYTGVYVACAPGDAFYIEAMCRRTSGTNGIGVWINYYDAAGTMIQSDGYASMTSSTWAKVSWSATAPTGAVKVFLAILSQAGTTGQFDAIYARRMVTGSIVAPLTWTRATVLSVDPPASIAGTWEQATGTEVAYCRDVNGRVNLRGAVFYGGAVGDPASAQPCFVFPVGMRPAAPRCFTVPSSATSKLTGSSGVATHTCMVDTDGSVTIGPTASNGASYYYFDGISFPAEQ